MQECIMAAWRLGYSTTIFMPEVYLGPDSEHLTKIKTKMVFDKRMVLLNNKHAVACDGEKIYDPKGYIYDYVNQDWQMFCLIYKI